MKELIIEGVRSNLKRLSSDIDYVSKNALSCVIILTSFRKTFNIKILSHITW